MFCLDAGEKATRIAREELSQNEIGPLPRPLPETERGDVFPPFLVGKKQWMC